MNIDFLVMNFSFLGSGKRVNLERCNRSVEPASRFEQISKLILKNTTTNKET